MPRSSPARQYRSLKRNKPCDRCREAKTRCQVLEGPSCSKCQRARLPCSFSSTSQPGLGSGAENDVQTTPAPTSLSQHEGSSVEPWPQTPTVGAATAASASQTGDRIWSAQHTPAIQNSEAELKINTQFSQSLEGIDGISAQLFGASSESDPWLLRHCKFDDFGSRSFQNSQYRNAGGVPFAHKIPIHFLIESDRLRESAKRETEFPEKQIASREELDAIVPPVYGQRLVAL